MKVNMLAMLISDLHGSCFVPITSAADIKTLCKEEDGLVKVRENIDSKPMVKFISIAGQPIELTPVLILKEGVVSRTVKTPGHTHTLEITANFSSGVVSSKLTSVVDSTGEEVDLDGQWRITYVSTSYTRPNRRHVQPIEKIDWVEECRKVMKETRGRYSSTEINHGR